MSDDELTRPFNPEPAIEQRVIHTDINGVRTIGYSAGHPDYWVSHEQDLLLDVGLQDGPVGEAGVNGVQVEHLLHICRDRLEWFQADPLRDPAAERYTRQAIMQINMAILALDRRTEERLALGIEGTGG